MSPRRLVKGLAFSLFLALAGPLLLGTWLEKVLTGTEAVFGTVAQGLSLVPGPIGRFLRAAYYFGTLDACHWEVSIGFGSVFTHRGARVARNVSTGAYCVLGHVVIGPGVRLASRISIPSGRRQHLDEAGKIGDGTRFDRVSVGSGTWIGEGAIILADVGRDCLVSAGAVIIKPVPPDCIVGGNPARILRAPDPADTVTSRA